MPARPSALRLLLAALLLAAPRAAAAATLYVNDAGADCAFPAAYTTIQDAVDAAKLAGAKRIHVCAGDYGELVSIDGFGTLTLEADPGVTLRPPGPVASATLLDVRDSRRVVVRGFTLDGDGQFSGAGTSIRGISYLDTSGTIEGNAIFGIRPEPFVNSFAHAIHVSDNVGSVRITIRDNTLGGYGQLGMDVTARAVKILDNVLAGSGPTDVDSQTGIILRNVARGRVARNTIGYHWYTPSRSATGIYLEESTRIRVDGNSLLDNHGGIAVSSGSASASRNRIANNDVDGAEYGIAVQGNLGAPAEANRISGNRVGGDADEGATGIDINDSAYGTRIAGNEIDDFAEPFDDAGTGTALKGNLCDGAPCP
jgi:parallel beta-helix repeat protein